MRIGAAFVAAMCLSCGGGDPLDTDASDTDDTGEPPCTGLSDTVTRWALPPLISEEYSEAWLPGVASSLETGTHVGGGLGLDCGTPTAGTAHFRVMDLTADGRPDLVVTLNGCDPTVGRDHWDLYVSDGTGFASSAIPWSLPARGLDPFPLTWDTSWAGYSYIGCEGGDVEYARWYVEDFDVDGWFDLVVTEDGCTEGVGTTRWDLYRGGASGFADQPVAWALPLRGTGEVPVLWRGPSSSAEYTCPGGWEGDISWKTLDLSGDGWFDLEIFEDGCGLHGVDPWEVYLGGPGGFAVEPIVWAFPPMRGDASDPAGWGRYASGDSDYTCANGSGGSLLSRLDDLDLDGAPDLVVKQDTCDPAIGRSHWELFAGGPQGFAPSPVQWTIPQRGADTDRPEWAHAGEPYACAGGGEGFLWYDFEDRTGDGLLDVVVKEDSCEGALQEGRWDVYSGSTVGFAATPVRWRIPARMVPPDGDYACPDEMYQEVAWALFDIDGDGVNEIVMVRDPCDRTVGRTHWNVYDTPCE